MTRTVEAKSPEIIEVTVRTNEGDERIIPASDIAEAKRIAKKLRTPDSYMVCVVQDGVRTMRWDRATIVGNNRWLKKDPIAFEQLGSVRKVTVKYISYAEAQAHKEQWMAESRLDNQAYADDLNALIAEETIRRAPSVREAIINVYEGLGINAMLNLIRKAPVLVETHQEYQAFQKRLRPLDPMYTPFSFSTECCGIKHPSADLSSTVQEQLKERGFKRAFVGWSDARGVKIEQWDWLELNRVRCDATSTYGWYDPVGILKIYETYADAIRKLQEEAGPTVRAFEQNHSDGWAAYRDGQLVSACTADPGSLEGYGWTSGWQSAYKCRADLPHEQVQSLRASGLGVEISFDQIPFKLRPDTAV